jgi:intracellular multiplication protein IcmJ
MSFLPLAPSVHPSTWTVEPNEAGREEIVHGVFERDDHTCRFCGHRAVGWQEVFHLDGDHDNWSIDNLVTACTLCHGAQHLGRVTVEQEQMLIWLPDMSQAALNAVVRRIHLVLYAHGEPAHLGEPPRSEHSAVHAALRAYQVLAAEARTIERRIHTASPRELGAALLDMSPYARERIPMLLGGVRLLHRGRHFRAGRDIYPQIVSGWAESIAPIAA